MRSRQLQNDKLTKKMWFKVQSSTVTLQPNADIFVKGGVKKREKKLHPKISIFSLLPLRSCLKASIFIILTLVFKNLNRASYAQPFFIKIIYYVLYDC